MKELLNFSIKGRLRRRYFWIGKIVILTVLIILFTILSFLRGFIGEDILAIFGLIALVFYAIFSFSLSIRRLHDLDISGWWLALQPIPFIGQIQFLILLFSKGTVGNNRFGTDTKTQISR